MKRATFKRDIDRRNSPKANRKRLSSVHRDKGRIKRSMKSDKAFSDFSAFCALCRFTVHVSLRALPLHICVYTYICTRERHTCVHTYFEQRPDTPGVNSKNTLYALLRSRGGGGSRVLGIHKMPLAPYFTHTSPHPHTRRGFMRNIACSLFKPPSEEGKFRLEFPWKIAREFAVARGRISQDYIRV